MIFLVSLSLFSCVDQKKFENIGIHATPRAEYAPNMYHSVAYESMSQITDPEAGMWMLSAENMFDGIRYGEFYNSNPYNPHRMTMRVPPVNTVKRGAYLPYQIPKDCVDVANKLVNPVSLTPQVLEDGRVLYSRYCAHCHGEDGKGEGPVNEALRGVANLTSPSVKAATHGYIFHVITHGRGRMGAHGSIVSQDERWRISHYVKEVLQKAEAE